jgi:hypothetical protein
MIGHCRSTESQGKSTAPQLTQLQQGWRALRVLQNAIVRRPCWMHSASSSEISRIGDRRRLSSAVPAAPCRACTRLSPPLSYERDALDLRYVTEHVLRSEMRYHIRATQESPATKPSTVPHIACCHNRVTAPCIH